MRFLVLGGSGLVGSHLIEAARAQGHVAFGTTRAAGHPDLRQLELGDVAATERCLEAATPDIVVHAAGWTWVDGCERDPARSRRENLEQPAWIARWCAARGARLVSFSTSYVFDGREGDYAESDPTDPVNVYGRHKADAERAVLDATGGAALVARLICVWGREAARKNFAYQVLKAASTGATLELPGDQRGNPSWAGDIATWTVRLCEKKASGIWHLAGPHPDMTRPEWAACILRGLAAAGHPAAATLVTRPTAELGQVARRPLRAGLCTDKVRRFHPLVCREPDCLPAGF